MRRLRHVVAVVVLGMMAAGTTRAADDKDAASVRSQLAQFDADAAKGNLDALLRLFAEDAMILGPGQPAISGKPAIKAWWKGILDQFQVEAVHDLAEVTAVGDVVVVRGRSRGMLTPRAGGAAVPVDTWFLQVYRRQADGSFGYWRGSFGPTTPASWTPR